MRRVPSSSATISGRAASALFVDALSGTAYPHSYAPAASPATSSTAAPSPLLRPNVGASVRHYSSPIGGPAPFGYRAKSANVSEVNAKIESMHDQHKRTRTPKKRILRPLRPSSSEGGEGGHEGSSPADGASSPLQRAQQRLNNSRREPTKEERRRAQLLGPFTQYIKMKGDAEANALSPDGRSSYAPPPATYDDVQQRPRNTATAHLGNQPDHLSAPAGHDATPLTRNDRRLFASSFQARGVYPADAHLIRDETNYDHPAFRQAFEAKAADVDMDADADEGIEGEEGSLEHPPEEDALQFIRRSANERRPVDAETAEATGGGGEASPSALDGRVEALFHRLRDLSAQELAASSHPSAAGATDSGEERIRGVGASQAFQGADPMLDAAEARGSALHSEGDDDETGAMVAGAAGHVAPREAFADKTGQQLAASSAADGSATSGPLTLAAEGTSTYLAAHGYAAEDLAYSAPIEGSGPLTFMFGGRDGQLSSDRLVAAEMARAEAAALAKMADGEGGEEALVARLKGEVKGEQSTSVFIPEAFLHKPFSELNQTDRWVPTSEVLPQHEIAKAVTRAGAAYLHHTTADMVARDLRSAGGEALAKDEATHGRAVATSAVAPRSSIFASDLDAVEKHYHDAVRAARPFPTLPPAFIHDAPQEAPKHATERTDATGRTVRTLRSAGDGYVVAPAMSLKANGSYAEGSARPVGSNGELPAAMNPHFPEEAVDTKAQKALPAKQKEEQKPKDSYPLPEEELEAQFGNIPHPHFSAEASAAPSPAAASEVDDGEGPVDVRFFSRFTTTAAEGNDGSPPSVRPPSQRATRPMGPEDAERRQHVRPLVKIRESPGVLGYRPPTLNDAENTRINRFSFDEWWGPRGNALVNDIEQYRKSLDAEGVEEWLHGEGVMDAIRLNPVSHAATLAARRYTHEYPKNELIQDEYVVISKIIPTDGSEATVVPVEHRMKMRVGEARRIAKGMGLDLVKVGSIGQHSISSYAQCIITDHRYDKRDYISHMMRTRGVVAPKPKECKDMGFRAATKAHDIWHKSFRVARMLLHGFPVRIWMKDIGAPREGMTAFQGALEGIKGESLKIKAFHTAGAVRMQDDLIECILYPSTIRNPKSAVVHPTAAMLARVRDHRIMEHEKEVFRDNVLETATRGKEGGVYLRKIANGTAWAHNDEGLSLRRLREVKKIGGWLPKGNKQLYEARGDVNMNHPFRAGNATSVDSVSYPRSSNLEQATRGIMTLAARAEMGISEMHDRGETEENESTLQRFYYTVSGDALEVGMHKESWGLKTNRRKLPRAAPGFATLGVEEDTELSAKRAQYFDGTGAT